MDVAETQALTWYQEIQRHGWAMWEAMRTVVMTEHEADALFLRLDWLTQHLPALVQAFRQDEG